MPTSLAIAPVNKYAKQGLKKVEAVVDSCAFDHVIPESCISNYTIKQGKSIGAMYTVGSGHEISHNGE